MLRPPPKFWGHPQVLGIHSELGNPPGLRVPHTLETPPQSLGTPSWDPGTLPRVWGTPPNLGTPPVSGVPLHWGPPVFWGPPGYQGPPPGFGDSPSPPQGFWGHTGGSSPSPGFGVPLPPSLSMGDPKTSSGTPNLGVRRGNPPLPPTPRSWGLLPPPALGGPSPPSPPPKFCQTNFGSSASNQRNRSRRGRGATKGHHGLLGPQ